ncbi:MAG: hypothetical protein R3F59_17835 [Myxococcota bacterium]
MLIAALWPCWAAAADPAPSDPPPEAPSASTEEPPPPDPDDLAALRARLDALEAELEQERQDALLREAEQLAAQAPPPPPTLPSSASAFNPALTAFGDVFGTLGVRDGAVLPGSTFWMRSLELDLRADVDPFAQAVAVFAVEQEPPALEPEPGAGDADTDEHSAFSAAPEELYVDFVSLPGGLSVRAGGFRQPFGITNRAHPHDYPWTDLPLPLEAVLGEEGLNDVGATATWRVPNRLGLGLSVTGGVNGGTRFDPDGTTAVPAWIGRAEYFQRAGKLDLALGASGTGQKDDAVVGGDLMLRWRANQWRSVLLLAEALAEPHTDTTGGYAALQLQPARPVYLGVRGDWLSVAGEPTWRAGAFASYYTSEFLRLRAGVLTDADALWVGNLQLTFVWGSHPVEPYWVNR